MLVRGRSLGRYFLHLGPLTYTSTRPLRTYVGRRSSKRVQTTVYGIQWQSPEVDNLAKSQIAGWDFKGFQEEADAKTAIVRSDCFSHTVQFASASRSDDLSSPSHTRRSLRYLLSYRFSSITLNPSGSSN